MIAFHCRSGRKRWISNFLGEKKEFHKWLLLRPDHCWLILMQIIGCLKVKLYYASNFTIICYMAWYAELGPPWILPRKWIQGVRIYQEQVGTGYYWFFLIHQHGFCGRLAVPWLKYTWIMTINMHMGKHDPLHIKDLSTGLLWPIW